MSSAEWAKYLEGMRNEAAEARKAALESKEGKEVVEARILRARVHRAILRARYPSMDGDLPLRIQDQFEEFVAGLDKLGLDELTELIKPRQMQLEALEGDVSRIVEPFFDKMTTMAHLREVDVKKAQELEAKAVAAVTRTEVIPGRCWVLGNVLSKAECDEVIKLSEASEFELAETYCHLYRTRNNDRLVCDDRKLADLVMSRVKHLLPTEHRPVVRGETETWSLGDINPRWRFCKYEPGHYFGAHIDGGFHESSKKKSFLTLMIYLNDKGKDFTGGSTIFLTRDFKPLHDVAPAVGQCLLFWQYTEDLLHEGAALVTGKKYMMRTDVMFTKAD